MVTPINDYCKVKLIDNSVNDLGGIKIVREEQYQYGWQTNANAGVIEETGAFAKGSTVYFYGLNFIKIDGIVIVPKDDIILCDGVLVRPGSLVGKSKVGLNDRGLFIRDQSFFKVYQSNESGIRAGAWVVSFPSRAFKINVDGEQRYFLPAGSICLVADGQDIKTLPPYHLLTEYKTSGEWSHLVPDTGEDSNGIVYRYVYPYARFQIKGIPSAIVHQKDLICTIAN